MFGNVEREEPNDGLPLVVICAGTGWSGVTGSDHHIATELAKYSTVLWVDPPVSALTRSHRRQGVGKVPWPRLQTIGPRFLRLTPTALPGHSRPGINATTGVLLRAQIRWALRRLGKKPHAVIACMLDDVLSGWKSDVVRVFYGTDDYAAGSELMGLSRTALLKNERRQLAQALGDAPATVLERPNLPGLARKSGIKLPAPGIHRYRRTHAVAVVDQATGLNQAGLAEGRVAEQHRRAAPLGIERTVRLLQHERAHAHRQ